MTSPILSAVFTLSMCLIFSLFLTAQLDNSVKWSWFIIFMPLYLLQFFYLTDAIYLMITKVRLANRSKLVKLSMFTLGVVLVYVAEILICLKLENIIEQLKLTHIFLPLWATMLLSIGFLFTKLAAENTTNT